MGQTLPKTQSKKRVYPLIGCFEVVNPLGSGKKKHRVLLVFVTLADLLLHNKLSITRCNLFFFAITRFTLTIKKNCFSYLCTGHFKWPSSIFESCFRWIFVFPKAIFPDQQLEPKHEYVSHYPKLIICFGPLIHLRFESKHTYYKQCAWKLHNF